MYPQGEATLTLIGALDIELAKARHLGQLGRHQRCALALCLVAEHAVAHGPRPASPHTCPQSEPVLHRTHRDHVRKSEAARGGAVRCEAAQRGAARDGAEWGGIECEGTAVYLLRALLGVLNALYLCERVALLRQSPW
eukprot:5696148-Prymnesium_polylepis.1